MRFDDRYLLPNWKEQNLHDLNCCFFILRSTYSPKWLLCPTNLVCWSSQIPKISWSSTTRPKMAVTPPPCHEFTKSCKNSSHLQDGILDGQPSHIPFMLLLLVDVIFVSQISILAIVPFLGTIITHVVTIWKLAAWKSDIKITRALLLWYFFNGQRRLSAVPKKIGEEFVVELSLRY